MENIAIDDVLSITIKSEWLGMASPAYLGSTFTAGNNAMSKPKAGTESPIHQVSDWEVVRRDDAFYAISGTPEKIEANCVESLLSAMGHVPIAEVNVINMGFTPEWLAHNVDRLMVEFFHGYSIEARNRFRPKLSNFDFFSRRVAELFRHRRWPDNAPSVRVTICTNSWRTIDVTSSSSWEPFMIPWTIETPEGAFLTHNAQLGRAIASLMPPGFLNREQLLGRNVIERAFRFFENDDLLDCPVCKVDGHKNKIEHLSFAPDASCVISTSSDAEMKGWDTTKWVDRHRFGTRQQGANLTVAFPPSTRLIAFNDARVLKLVDRETAEVKLVLEGHNWIINNLAVSPDGLLLASCDSDGIILWDISRRTEIARLKNVQLLGFSYDSAKLITLNRDGMTVHHVSSFHQSSVNTKCDKKCLASDGTGLAWSDEKSRIYVLDLRQECEIAMFKKSGVSHLTLSRGCSFLGCAIDGGNTIFVVNLLVPTDQFTTRTRSNVRWLTFSDDADRLLVCYERAFDIWDVRSRNRVKSIRTQDITCVAMSPDAKTVLTGHWDGSFRVWSVTAD